MILEALLSFQHRVAACGKEGASPGVEVIHATKWFEEEALISGYRPFTTQLIYSVSNASLEVGRVCMGLFSYFAA